MREIVFQKQNKAKWEKLETTFSQSKSISPDLLAESYIEVINDLSYAKTHYKNSDSHNYLNQLAGKYHQLIYQNKKEKRNRFVKFWTTELPLVVRRNHRFVLLSFLLLSFFTFIGAISAWNDASFVRLILGDAYVDMTLENIKNGRPMDVYGHTREDLMFLMIGLNNVMVAIWSYASGILINFGTSDQGFGEEQTQSTVRNQQQSVEQEVVQENQTTQSTEQEVLTQTSEEAPSVIKKEEKQIIEEEVKEEPKPSK
ncbi:MAG: hypothetical protein KTR13_00300, partial [Saprospiraceae bacterium]|nr:hypothetical protein [Saprospiraceae bacterium]